MVSLKKTLSLFFCTILLTSCTPTPFSNKNNNTHLSLPQTVPTQNAPLPAPVSFLKVPAGFRVSVFAKDLHNARDLLAVDQELLLLSTPSQGKVFAVWDRDQNGIAETQWPILENLSKPHGLALRTRGSEAILYVAEENGVSSYAFDLSANKKEETLRKIVRTKQSLFSLPTGGRHTTRSLITPPTSYQGPLYIAIGSACDVCNESDQRRGTIQVWDGQALKPFATGLRNAVFMALHPVTGKIWATEMGRDQLGDNLPPDEVNVVEEGENYGWPVCYGNKVHDTNFDKQGNSNACDQTIAARINLPAHSASLGLDFSPTQNWPLGYQNNLVIAYHGSWNRSQPTGYKVVRYQLDEQGNIGLEQDFIIGWMDENNNVVGRPVDIESSGDSIYISDDKAGVIYRLIYAPQ
jgi:glucose/arabinose dehydrogenase